METINEYPKPAICQEFPDCISCPQMSKDFCDGAKSSMRASKKDYRDKNVNGTLNLLKKNNIKYEPSSTPNVVIINPDTDNIMLSLKKESGLIKCKYPGNKKWYTYSRAKFIEKFKQG